jgi:SpoVK/Ycf46/Vps4 family AAA+-type ATPase
MARSDLLVKLVKAGNAGDIHFFRKVVEALIAEEKSKQHHILANLLEQELKSEKPDAQSLSNIFITRPDQIDSFVSSFVPKTSFEDLILDLKVESELKLAVTEHHRKDLLRSYNLEPRNRILLVGPPGNGKTSTAEAFAEALMIPFYIIKYEGIIGSFLGETASRLKQTFDFLRTQECVVFFDEFDAIGKERGDIHETGEIKRVVNSLLLQIDKLPSYVTVIAATNHPELLDRAIWRRFQIRLELKKPTTAKILAWLQKFGERFNKKLPVSPQLLAKKLFGLSFSEIEEFGLTIQRKYVLSLPASNLKQIINESIQDIKLKYSFKPDEQ